MRQIGRMVLMLVVLGLEEIRVREELTNVIMMANTLGIILV